MRKLIMITSQTSCDMFKSLNVQKSPWQRCICQHSDMEHAFHIIQREPKVFRPWSWQLRGFWCQKKDLQYFILCPWNNTELLSGPRSEDNVSSELIGLASFSNFIIPQTALKEISFCDVFQFRWENRWGLRCLTNTLSWQALTRFSILSVCTEACSQLKVKTNIGVPTQTLPHNLSPPSAVTLI